MDVVNYMGFKKARKRVQVGLLLFLSCLLLSGSFIVLDWYLFRLGGDFVSSWLKSETVAIQEGHLLQSISKSERFLFSSDFVRSVAVFEATPTQMKVLADFGQPIMAPAPTIQNALVGSVIGTRTGAFHYQYHYRVPTRPELMIVFEILSQFARKVSVFFLFFTFGIGVVSIFLLRHIERQESRHRMQMIRDAIDQLVHDQVPSDPLRSEIPSLVESWTELQGKIQELLSTQGKLTLQAKLGEMASQVAHDIRSPLAALEAVVAGSAKLPEDQRILVRSAVSRIRDIANTLLERNRAAMKAKLLQEGAPTASAPAQEPLPPSVQLISSLIEPLVSEKRMQFRSKGGIEINGTLNASSYGLFAKVEPTEFKRVLSNLINNAVEALGERGRVEVALARVKNEVRITLEDNGKGIPKEILFRLGQRGETHGKAGGSGLGLYHARTQIEAWGGRFEIISEEGRGTVLVLSLPVALPSAWFLSQIAITEGSTVIILDDDASIHQIWKGRFESLDTRTPVSLLFFSSGSELERWVQQAQLSVRDVLYLCDYELLGEKETGLDLIERLGIARQAVLVTSRFEEPPVRERCEKLGIKLLPKGLTAFVPIRIAVPKKKWDAILIDDDPLVHMTWKAQADRNQKSLLAFTSADVFLKESEAVDPCCVIYIDSNLGNGVKGEEVARQIFELGFSEIYLATGYETEKFASMPHLKGFVGKSPPF